MVGRKAQEGEEARSLVSSTCISQAQEAGGNCMICAGMCSAQVGRLPAERMVRLDARAEDPNRLTFAMGFSITYQESWTFTNSFPCIVRILDIT